MNDTYDSRWISRRRFLKEAAAVIGGATLVRTFPAAAAPTLRPLRQEAAVNIMDPAFGVKGDGTTNDRAAFQAAMDAAVAAGVPLWIPRPEQFYRIVLEPEHRNLRVNGDLTVIGAGRKSTLLRYTVQNPGTGQPYSGFYVPGGVNFQLANLRLEEDLHQPIEQFEFMGVLFESGSVDHVCLVENVDIDGFTYCLYTPASAVDGGYGELFLTVRNCDLHPWWQYCIAFWTVPEGHKRLHIYDSYLHDNQNSHLIYCHPHNSVHVENTRFDGATSWAFQFQGTLVAGDPEYHRFVGCWFGPRNSRAIITQDRQSVAVHDEIRNCVFEAAPAIQIRSDITIDGCYFTTGDGAANGSQFVAAYSNSPWRATIRDCIFAPRGDSLPQVDLRLEDIEVEIENCQFYNQGVGTILSLGKGVANRYAIKDCLFYNRPDNASFSVSLEIDNGQALVERCRFIGRATHDRGVILLTSGDMEVSTETFIQFEHCSFQNVNEGSLFYVINPGWSDKISGSGNQIINWQSPRPLLGTESPTPIIGRLTPIGGKAPTTLPAGATLVISSNYDAFDMLGAADVANIHWWTADGLSNTLFAGAITLYATVPFAVVTGGNIQLAGGITRREIPATGSIRLVYDPAQGFWNEG